MRIVTSKTKEVFSIVEDEDILQDIQQRALVELEAPILQFPKLYFVRHKNPFIRPGKFVERMEDGYEECIVDSENGRLVIRAHRGPVFPHATLAPFLQAVRKHGLDTGSERMDRRRAMEQIGG